MADLYDMQIMYMSVMKNNVLEANTHIRKLKGQGAKIP